MLKAVEKLAPPDSKRKKHRPYMTEFIATIKLHLKLDTPLDAAVFACLTTCFYAAARLGKFTTSTQGEDVYWAKQEGDTDPATALKHHLLLNAPLHDNHLFAYKHKNGHRPLTKTKFLERVALAARAAGLEPLQGHGIRIGATLEYLLCGIPFNVMKAKGRWASDAFLLYLTKHAQVLAPYMQAVPQVHKTFTQYIVPPVR
ncbi:hypothetical protein BYT27DRAFT_7247793 [Phlegmacium glaucopus]|nr:hypothetical protein BYT27DRAFT_7247793 [Phlegmacium glaucopus]